MKTHVPLKLGIAEIYQPIKYLTLGDPCPRCGYPPHEEVVCPPPPQYPALPDEAVALAEHTEGEDIHTDTSTYVLPRCSSPLRRAYVHQQGVALARSALTRTDYAITHGLPTGAPRHPPLDLNLNIDPQGIPPTEMDIEVSTRVQGLKEGQASTKYFHKLFHKRQASAKFRVLQKDTGEILEDPDLILQEFTSLYRHLYSGFAYNDDNIHALTKVLAQVTPTLQPAQHAFLDEERLMRRFRK
ncbi:hypothetical protein R1sor_006215 [Riccia sorocarpa]|uniref:Uncharacterized protein n=1 Tax=Riccia sorocarpa TaxID=122646 RepID=A0ABD3HQE8_9MARC